MAYDATINGSNHIYLNGTTQSVPYAITSGIEVCYYGVAAKAFVKDTASNPYTMTTSHSSLFSSTITITDADLAELTADSNKIYRIWFGSETLASGFSKANIGNFYGGNEGLASGAHIQDLGTDLGTEATTDMPTDAVWGDEVGSYTRNGTDSFDLSVTIIGTALNRPYVAPINNSMGAALHRIMFYATVNSGTPILSRIFDGADTFTINLAIVDGWNTLYVQRSTTGSLMVIYFDGRNLFNISISNYSTREATAVEIQAYDSATRTTLANQSNGASNLKLVQDGSGRTTGIAAANTTQWKADGRTAVTGWTITAPFTITEETDDDTYTYLSNGNRYKNNSPDGTYTVPTGIWTLDHTRFDGTAGVTKRGNTKMVDSLQIP